MALQRYILLVFLVLTPFTLLAQIRNDDPVVEMLDSLDLVRFFRNNKFSADRNTQNIYNFREDEIPEYTEEEYRKRMEKLDVISPFSLQYNPSVKMFIDLYAKKRRSLCSRMLGLSQLYFPLYEEKMAKYNIPLELKYLSIVESALNPTATSRVGAKGLWQFMYRTGLMYGLQANSYVDDRSDPELATEAACKYLKYLHSLYNDWNLALAAYNAGPGNVNKAIRRAGGSNDYWVVREFLPQETQSYVPAFIAVVYVMTYHKEHNIFPVEPKYFNYEIDSVYIHKNVSFKQVSDLIDVPYEDVKFLNPMYIKDLIPGASKPYPLWLPKKFVGDFLANESKLYAPPVQNDTVQKTVPGTNLVDIPAPDTARVRVDYVVQKGEYISLLAKRYQVRVTDIMEWNKLTTQTLNVNQKLVIYADKGVVASLQKQSLNTPVREQAQVNPPQSQAKYKYYTIQSGDTLYKIAAKYHVTVADLMKWNNLKSKTIHAGSKLKIKIG